MINVPTSANASVIPPSTDIFLSGTQSGARFYYSSTTEKRGIGLSNVRERVVLAVSVCLFGIAFGATSHTSTSSEAAEINHLKQTTESLARQIMMLQLSAEERIRTDGDSGLKSTRGHRIGTRPYFSQHFSGGTIGAIHDHSNYDRTVGMGELNMVINGVDFRTRHNDYKLKMPHRTKKDYGATEDIPFPDVPPRVKAKHTVAEQIKEMQEYFRAFKDQNTRIRSDYDKYFKPVLCYMEAGWTTDTKSLSEPFESDRHFLEANSWFDLTNKVEFTDYTGGKSNHENYSFLPTRIMRVNNGTPEFAQWNYRILCHPIKRKLHRYDLILEDDFAPRLSMRRTMKDYAMTRSARFRVAAGVGSRYDRDAGYGQESDRALGTSTIDYIMEEIPGKDNYPGHLYDASFGMIHDNIHLHNATKLNTAYYHRVYKVRENDAMGQRVVWRGFQDKHMWTAQTSSSRISPAKIEDCNRNSKTHKMECKNFEARYTYAVPLELIWLTPLYSWNPYGLKFWTGRDYNVPNAHGRNGGLTKDKAYNGTNAGKFYFTPAEFFHGGEVERDPADTAKDTIGVLDAHGNLRKVAPSGTKIFTPNIPNVGVMRMRYPVMPAHVEGNAIYKELDALKAAVMNMQTYERFFERDPFHAIVH
ncbi:hypothetical protein FSP39_001070 [Pinctada imbricata]|uniref:Uncharacterized protein n=1 Tax=Pinctada imbricata TaxID=66713 RepID=A0AA88XP84_PINIB|nr:hypothetical protein FSP39_001070 [Pinctada imbricata]